MTCPYSYRKPGPRVCTTHEPGPVFSERRMFWIRMLTVITACVVLGLLEGAIGGPIQ